MFLFLADCLQILHGTPNQTKKKGGKKYMSRMKTRAVNSTDAKKHVHFMTSFEYLILIIIPEVGRER